MMMASYPAEGLTRLLAAVDALPARHDCPGLATCRDHPRWRVVTRPGSRGYAWWGPDWRRTTHHVYRPHAAIAEAARLDHAEAMDVATERARADHLAAIEAQPDEVCS